MKELLSIIEPSQKESIENDQVMKLQLLLKESGPKIVYVAGKTSTVTNAIIRLDMDPTYTVDTAALQDLGKNDYNHGWHLHMTMALSQLL